MNSPCPCKPREKLMFPTWEAVGRGGSKDGEQAGQVSPSRIPQMHSFGQSLPSLSLHFPFCKEAPLLKVLTISRYNFLRH